MYLDPETYHEIREKLTAPEGKFRLVESDKFEFEPEPIVLGDYETLDELKENLPSGQWYAYDDEGDLVANSEDVIKARISLGPGESAPEGFTEQRGPKGGRFYESEEQAPEKPEATGDQAPAPEGKTAQSLDDLKRRGPGEGEEIGIANKQLMNEILTQGTFGLVSAGRNPEHEEDSKLTDEQIQARTEELRNDLIEKGYVFTKVIGNYGENEDSFLVMVHDAEEGDVVELGTKYNQDSIIFTKSGQNNLIFTTGENQGKRYVGQGHQELPAEQESFFTQVDMVEEEGPWKFTLNFDFDQLQDGETGPEIQEAEEEPDHTPEEALETADTAQEEIVEDPIEEEEPEPEPEEEPEEEPEKIKVMSTKQIKAKLKNIFSKQWKTGKKVNFDYVRKTKAHTDIGIAGRFLQIDNGKILKKGWQRGSMQFDNPLVIPHANWGEDLTKAFDLSGRNLSEAIVAQGHDGLVTLKGKKVSDIIELHSVRKTLMKSVNIQKPFAGFKDFADCEAQNQDKEDPGAYCAVIQRNVEGDSTKEKRAVTCGKLENVKYLPGILKIANHAGQNEDAMEVHWADDMYYISKGEDVVWEGTSAVEARNEWRERTGKALIFMTKSDHLPTMDTVWADANLQEREKMTEILGQRNTTFYAKKDWNNLPVKFRGDLIKDAPVVTSTPGAYNPSHRRRRELIEYVGQQIQIVAKEEDLELDIEKQDDIFIKFLLASTYQKAFQGVSKTLSDQAKAQMVRMLLKQDSMQEIAVYLARKLKIQDAQAEKIARTEVQAIQNGIREYAFKQSDPEDHNVYKWLGPQDHRTTKICERIKKRSARGVKMDKLRQIVKEEVEKGIKRGELPADFDPREWTPHYQCRHRFIRHFR
ncbi:hypothetical protein IIA15_01050 [candidate division TA06 bacterium]|nr:hypothetical protein [candidate division TA06 bacterium]